MRIHVHPTADAEKRTAAMMNARRTLKPPGQNAA
jgi:hypothetical protein